MLRGALCACQAHELGQPVTFPAHRGRGPVLPEDCAALPQGTVLRLWPALAARGRRQPPAEPITQQCPGVVAVDARQALMLALSVPAMCLLLFLLVQVEKWLNNTDEPGSAGAGSGRPACRLPRAPPGH